ncbi:MAG: class I SAM-dependent methyltransferase [Nitrospira defluvii]|nr:class I SAM-dependent methyltransferase [Nitrospira defluvii]
MNPVLERILRTKLVNNGRRDLPLHSNVVPGEGPLLQQIVHELLPKVTLEIGMAYGVSTLYICEALQQLPHQATHIVMDPAQSSHWEGIGLRHVREAGYEGLIRFYEEGSEFVLPRLLGEGTVLDMAFIDGLHTFDQVLLDFYYVNRMLRPGGVIVFDDVDMPSIQKALRCVLTYPCYELYDPSRFQHGPGSLFGRLRSTVATLPGMSQVLHPHFVRRAWEMGLSEPYVAVRKTGPDDREWTWYEDF